MALYVDHVFITCDIGAPEAHALVERGFLEGSPNEHIGQGTANRRFFFSNFMLELLWVRDPIEVTSEKVRDTSIGERWTRRGEGISRFGVVFGGEAPGDSPLPFSTQSYFPAYLPPGMSIEVVRGMTLHEPALFWMPWCAADRPRGKEPTEHSAPVRTITGIAIGVPITAQRSLASRRVCEAGLLEFTETTSPVLEVRFQAQQEHRIDCRPHLPLVFRGIA